MLVGAEAHALALADGEGDAAADADAGGLADADGAGVTSGVAVGAGVGVAPLEHAATANSAIRGIVANRGTARMVDSSSWTGTRGV